MLVVEPIPGGDDDVALDPLRSFGPRMGQLALGDAVGPVREVAERRGAEILDQRVEHSFAGLPGLDAADPRLLGSGELAHRERNAFRERARGKLAHLMAAHAGPVLYLGEITPERNFGGNLAFAAELVLVRNLEHGIPINRRIEL